MTGGGHDMKTARDFACSALIVIFFAEIILTCIQSVQADSHTPLSAQREAVRIGICMPVKGPFAELSRFQADGIKMACEMAKGKSSRPVELLFRDSGTTAQEFSLSLQKLLREEKISGIISNVPHDLIARNEEIIKQGNVPFISTSSAGRDWAEKDGLPVVRLCAGPEDQAQACARFITDVVRARRIGLVVNDKDELSVRIASLFSASLLRTGGRVEDIVYVRPSEDPAEAIAHLMGKKPEAVYMPTLCVGTNPALMKIRAFDVLKPVLVGNILDEETFMREVRSSLEGVYVQTNYIEEKVSSSLGKEFVSYFSKHSPKRAYLGEKIATGAEAYFLMLHILSSQMAENPKEKTGVPLSWKPALLGMALNASDGHVKNSLFFGQIKRKIFGGATIKYVATISVPRSDPVTNVRAQ